MQLSCCAIETVLSIFFFLLMMKSVTKFHLNILTKEMNQLTEIHDVYGYQLNPIFSPCNDYYSFTCCSTFCEWCFGVVSIHWSLFTPHHLFILYSVLSWLLLFSDYHFTSQGYSEHFMLYSIIRTQYSGNVLYNSLITMHYFTYTLYLCIAGCHS